MEMDEEDEKNKETYVVGDLGGVHATWRMNDFKMSVVVATWESKNALKIRLEEKKTQVSLNFTHQFGRGSLLTKSILLFQRPKPSFYREEDRSSITKEAYKRSFTRKHN